MLRVCNWGDTVKTEVVKAEGVKIDGTKVKRVKREGRKLERLNVEKVRGLESDLVFLVHYLTCYYNIKSEY